jgi:hypothetical protein
MLIFKILLSFLKKSIFQEKNAAVIFSLFTIFENKKYVISPLIPGDATNYLFRAGEEAQPQGGRLHQ